jgi:methylthioribose-1-phosphate isomerase
LKKTKKVNIIKNMELPLLARSAWIEDDEIVVLDETSLPDRIKYIRCKDYKDVVNVIKGMKTRAYGQVLTSLLALVITAKRSSKKELFKNLNEARESIQRSRPTFPFKSFLDPVLLNITEDTDANEVEKRILNMIDEMNRRRIDRAIRVSSFIKDGDTILTHCNVSGELVIIGKICRERGKRVKFIATETRPYFQGSRLTAWELSKEGFNVKIVADSSVANVIKNGMVSLVIVGSDRSANNGDIINKIGTYQIAIIAKKYNIPFYVLAQKTSDLLSGDNVFIEIRNEKELLEFNGRRITEEGIKGFYPAFDITPARFVDKIFFL